MLNFNIYGLSEKVRLSSFGGKTYIYDFGSKIKFLVLLGNFDFLVLGKNMILCLAEKRFFFCFDGNTNFWIRWENLSFFCFGGKHINLRFWRKRLIFFLFQWKTQF